MRKKSLIILLFICLMVVTACTSNNTNKFVCIYKTSPTLNDGRYTAYQDGIEYYIDGDGVYANEKLLFTSVGAKYLAVKNEKIFFVSDLTIGSGGTLDRTIYVYDCITNELKNTKIDCVDAQITTLDDMLAFWFLEEKEDWRENEVVVMVTSDYENYRPLDLNETEDEKIWIDTDFGNEIKVFDKKTGIEKMKDYYADFLVLIDDTIFDFGLGKAESKTENICFDVPFSVNDGDTINIIKLDNDEVFIIINQNSKEYFVNNLDYARGYIWKFDSDTLNFKCIYETELLDRVIYANEEYVYTLSGEKINKIKLDGMEKEEIYSLPKIRGTIDIEVCGEHIYVYDSEGDTTEFSKNKLVAKVEL